MSYNNFSLYSILCSLTLLLSAFFLNMWFPLTVAAGTFALLGMGFLLVQGKCQFGYYYATCLFGISMFQLYVDSSLICPWIAMIVGILFTVLQTIEFICKHKKLLS